MAGGGWSTGTSGKQKRVVAVAHLVSSTARKLPAKAGAGNFPRLDMDRIRRSCSLLPMVPQDPLPRRNGKSSWMCRCPFHDDSTASLSVRLASFGWAYNCFGCGAHGDVVSYVMRIEGWSFIEAARFLASADHRPTLVPLPPPPPPKAWVMVCDECGDARAELDPLDVTLLCDGGRGAWLARFVGDHVEAVCPPCARRLSGLGLPVCPGAAKAASPTLGANPAARGEMAGQSSCAAAGAKQPPPSPVRGAILGQPGGRKAGATAAVVGEANGVQPQGMASLAAQSNRHASASRQSGRVTG